MPVKLLGTLIKLFIRQLNTQGSSPNCAQSLRQILIWVQCSSCAISFYNYQFPNNASVVYQETLEVELNV